MDNFDHERISPFEIYACTLRRIVDVYAFMHDAIAALYLIEKRRDLVMLFYSNYIRR